MNTDLAALLTNAEIDECLLGGLELGCDQYTYRFARKVEAKVLARLAATPPEPLDQPSQPCSVCNALIVDRNPTHYDQQDLDAAEVRARILRSQLRVEPLDQSAEPAVFQYRFFNTSGWWAWRECSPGVYASIEAYIKIGYRYEVRKLYAATLDRAALRSDPVAATGATSYRFEVFVNDECLAQGDASLLADADREANHYAVMYSSEGPVEIKLFSITELRPVAAIPASGDGPGSIDHAFRCGFIDGQIQMRDEYADLRRAVEAILDAGHMNTEDLARLRAASGRQVDAASPLAADASPTSAVSRDQSDA